MITFTQLFLYNTRFTPFHKQPFPFTQSPVDKFSCKTAPPREAAFLLGYSLLLTFAVMSRMVSFSGEALF